MTGFRIIFLKKDSNLLYYGVTCRNVDVNFSMKRHVLEHALEHARAQAPTHPPPARIEAGAFLFGNLSFSPLAQSQENLARGNGRELLKIVRGPERALRLPPPRSEVGAHVTFDAINRVSITGRLALLNYLPALPRGADFAGRPSAPRPARAAGPVFACRCRVRVTLGLAARRAEDAACGQM
ncbi:hypothetical protein EVAR_53274_1 [Eumeta japonica]|uniref:Uncharacterized protein n=1 Tax=Eumeta variegata TaxID=151549 RepID=A0A4C1YKR8_EUMVA|nr:hypothetical protein EVAR_53274_1 [Eumeta japonica]